MKRNILALTLTLLSIVVFSQETDTKRPLNSIYLNLLGEGSLISANFDRLFPISPNFHISGNIGLGYNQEINILGGSNPYRFLTIPHHLTGNIGKKRHLFEFGVGGTQLLGKDYSQYAIYPIIGYRLQPLKTNKFFMRASLHVPLQEIQDEWSFSVIGVSFGKSF